MYDKLLAFHNAISEINVTKNIAVLYNVLEKSQTMDLMLNKDNIKHLT
jgi:hypothetical protein